MQRPARQASPVVHSLPSLQAVPSGAAVPWHTPRVQLPCTHPSPSSQGVPSSTAPPTQRPSRHCSSVVQGLPSSQRVPSVTTAPVQVPLTQCSSVVQGLPSSQGVPSGSWALPVHSPAWQVSTVVHPLPSLQGVSLSLFGFEHCPEVGSQVPASWHWSSAVQTTGLEPVQVPFWQVSAWVQALPSLHAVPLLAFGWEHWPVAVSQVPATWHWSEAVQTAGMGTVPVPLWQVFVWAQALPSLHAVPLLAFGWEHRPVAVLQVPATWHWSSALQTTGLAPVQVPLWQVSACVQALPSLHAVPLLAFGLEHWPVAVLQVPATWHWSSALQTTGLLPVQSPLWQVSVCVQALPSLHAVPLLAFGLEHWPVAVLQVPATWHWSEAVQTTGLLPVQSPLWQASVCVQALPSLHAVPLLAFGLEHWPVAVLQVPATWHWSEAVQTTGLLPVQSPLWQASVCVQALPSLHAVPLLAFGLEHWPVAVSPAPAT